MPEAGENMIWYKALFIYIGLICPYSRRHWTPSGVESIGSFAMCERCLGMDPDTSWAADMFQAVPYHRPEPLIGQRSDRWLGQVWCCVPCLVYCMLCVLRGSDVSQIVATVQRTPESCGVRWFQHLRLDRACLDPQPSSIGRVSLSCPIVSGP